MTPQNELIYNTPWKKDLYNLIQKAITERKWLWCSHQNMWFTPEILLQENRNGKYIWGINNWILRDPLERLAEVDIRVRSAIVERDYVLKLMKEETHNDPTR